MKWLNFHIKKNQLLTSKPISVSDGDVKKIKIGVSSRLGMIYIQDVDISVLEHAHTSP